MTFDYVIRAAADQDRAAVREVHTIAFGNPAWVPGLLDSLHTTPAALKPISLVATVDDQVVGHVLLSACRLDADRRLVDVFSLSPLGVHPEYQKHGIATDLIATVLAAADEQGVPLVFLEGSPTFYGKRGFATASAHGFRAPSHRIPDPAFQVHILSSHEPWMTGTFVYSEAFWAHDCVGLRESAQG